MKKSGFFLKEKEAVHKKINTELDLAKQRPNPQVNIEYLKGEQQGGKASTINLNAQHVFEFGNKRLKRINKAKTNIKMNHLVNDLNFNKNISNALLSYQKASQLSYLSNAIEEAIQVFDVIIKKLDKRKWLNPEETVSLSTLKLARMDYYAQKNDILNELDFNLMQLNYITGCNFEQIVYEEVNPDFMYRNSNSSHGKILLEDLKVELALTEVERQKSLGYSNISVGPSIEFQEQENDKFFSTGISISFSLPLFQTNDGGKKNVLENYRMQKIKSENTKILVTYRRKKLIKKIQNSLLTLSKMPKLKNIENKHLKSEKLFSRGLVSIQMSIESHRQQIEYLESLFETENDILVSLGELSVIDGDLSRFKQLLQGS